jgi:photosystem II stability/assembly factor-like uncharacterized protein
MMKRYVLWALFLFVCLSAGLSASADKQDVIWNEMSRGIRDSNLYTVAADPENRSIIYTSSGSSLYRTSDGGSTWSEILSFRASGKGINAIAIAPAHPDTVFAGSDDGVYRSHDRGLNWKRIFKGVGVLQNSVRTIAVHPRDPGTLYIGTLRGIFKTENSGTDWTRGRNLPTGAIITSIAIDPVSPDILYAATDMGIYKSLNGGALWIRILKSNFPEKDNLIPALQSSIESGESDYHEIKSTITEKIKIRSLAVDQGDSRIIYAGMHEGLFISRDSGMTWNAAAILGLLSRNIRHITVGPADSGRVYAATGRGVFTYSMSFKAWEELHKGITTPDIRYLASGPHLKDKAHTIWAATKRGIFKTGPAEQHADFVVGDRTEEDILSMFSHEPSIEEIRAATIEYADVHPDKIRNWRKEAANRAWLPDIRFAYDKGRDWHSSNYFYSTAKEKFKDDDITQGNDKGWAVSLTWELGDLIWNNDQTSIDNRSKLMVQLRDDMLNEVTRLYFERRRLQVDMRMSSPVDQRSRIDMELRLQELTASIDSLTGSYLSKRLAQTGVRAQGQEKINK